MNENPLKVKTILVSQPKPEGSKTIYDDLIAKYKLKVDFRPFIQIDPVPARELRKKSISILDHTAVILTSKNGVDHFFRICDEMRVTLPIEFKYFCTNEAIANYIQHYTLMRKRKVFFPKKKGDNFFLKLLNTHKKENFLFACSDIRKPMIPDFLTKQGLQFTEAIMYYTVSADLSDLENVFYDIIVFFSPADIKSLYDNFPQFKQNSTRLAAFGQTTLQAIEEAGLNCQIPAPTPEAPSIVKAIENYIEAFGK